MNNELLQQIDLAIENCREELTRDTIKLIAVKSVQGEPEPGAPFGRGPRNMLDATLEMGREAGFYTTDYEVGVVSLGMQEGQPDLGIWLHGDVVPEGPGWNFDPYDAVEHNGCIIGRGSCDNKGQLCAMFHLLKIFKKLGISLHYNPAIYVGSNEESGMYDMRGIPGNDDAKGFCNVCTPPRLSLVPDSGFPIGIGANGSILMNFTTDTPLGVTMTAGLDDAPGKATAQWGGNTVVTESEMLHPSLPDPKGNMITQLMDRLLEENAVAQEHRSVLEFFRRLSLDVHGDSFGINVKTEQLPQVTVFVKKLETVNGRPSLLVNVRYPFGITAEEIEKILGEEAARFGVTMTNFSVQRKPYLLDRNWPILQMLAEIANSVTGEHKEPYTISGGTYAHMLPNAFIYGTDANVPPADFPADRGKAHGLDEAASLDRLQRAMRIYARALLALNETDW